MAAVERRRRVVALGECCDARKKAAGEIRILIELGFVFIRFPLFWWVRGAISGLVSGAGVPVALSARLVSQFWIASAQERELLGREPAWRTGVPSVRQQVGMRLMFQCAMHSANPPGRGGVGQSAGTGAVRALAANPSSIFWRRGQCCGLAPLAGWTEVLDSSPPSCCASVWISGLARSSLSSKILMS